MANGEHKVRPATVVITVLTTILALAAAGVIAMSSKAHSKAAEASDAVLKHDGGSVAHPVLQERIAGNYEKIQIQQKAIIADVGDLDEKIDRVLEAVEK